MATAMTKYDVERFDRKSSFSLWKNRMKSQLVMQGLWKAITEDYPLELRETEKANMMERALSVIFISVTNDVLHEISELNFMNKAWKKLKELYSTKLLMNRLYLKKKLYTFQMTKGTLVNSHLDEFNSIIMDIKNVNIKIDNEDQALIILCLLLSSYETFTNVILYGKDSISLYDVSNAVKSKELKKSFQIIKQKVRV